jgi:UDP-N-acetylmuramate: L-alanyl-gamma-D-glutamyl-meso-diaminopimelate ligase
MKHLHILGIGGTFMSALALLAREDGYKVTGSDANCYPPVSDLLAAKGITWTEGYEDITQALQADCVIVGNAIKRGMPVLEAILNAGKAYTSGPQWLAEHILPRYRVFTVAGTHGKTTTTSMLAFILSQAGLDPAYLIGGVATDFNTSAHLGRGKCFVIEADEYDSAFFDKRPKFMHYRPEVAILNNLEFDHADIYENLPAIQQQFHYFLRTIPSKGIVIKPRDDAALNEVLRKGEFCGIENLAFEGNATWRAELLDDRGQAFRIWHLGEAVAEIHWGLIGRFNIENGLAAFAASHHAGVSSAVAAKALERFTPVKRRLEVKSSIQGVTIYDDFAHHPTAIMKTIDALKQSGRHKRIFVVLEFASFTMRSGVHADKIGSALAKADGVYVLNPEQFDLHELAKTWQVAHQLLPSVASIIETIANKVESGDAVLVMSNRGFENIHQRLADKIRAIYA